MPLSPCHLYLPVVCCSWKVFTQQVYFIWGAAVNQLASSIATVVSLEFLARQCCTNLSFSWEMICKTNAEQSRLSRRLSWLDEQMLVMMFCLAKYEYGRASVCLGYIKISWCQRSTRNHSSFPRRKLCFIQNPFNLFIFIQHILFELNSISFKTSERTLLSFWDTAYVKLCKQNYTVYCT